MGTLKTVSIGDIHGNEVWKKVNPDKYDKIIFMGDYVDSFVYPDIHIKENLEDIIEFKLKYMDKVILLWGNHDLQYLFTYKDFGCSGYRPEMYADLHELFNETKELFQAAYEVSSLDFRYLWTHAGVHTGWYYQRFLPTFYEKACLVDLKLGKRINTEFEKKNTTLFDIGIYRGGYQSVGGPFWVDRKMLSPKPMKYFHQIVGHNRVDGVKTVDHDAYTSVVYVDCLDYEEDSFYKLDIYDV